MSFHYLSIFSQFLSADCHSTGDDHSTHAAHADNVAHRPQYEESVEKNPIELLLHISFYGENDGDYQQRST